MGVETREQAPAAAYGRSARLADALLQALRSAGVADADIRTAGVGLQPEYTAKPDAAPEITGWRASHTLTVRLHDIERVPDILERTVGILGADGRINSIHFGIEDSDALLMQARAEAFANARAAAERLAQAAGLRLATLLAAEDAGVVSPLPRATDARMMAMSADLGGEVMPGQIDVSASVVVEYALRR